MSSGSGTRRRSSRSLIEGLRRAGLDVAVATVGPGAPEVSTRAGTAKPSIAVLPFANISADANQDYFSDGLAEEIINLLARISGLKVIARTSSFSFRGREQDVRRIAESLGVTHVLEGSVRRAGDRVRVTAQLIAAADGGQLWSERYDRELSDLFALQDDIASAITRALQITLSGSPAARRYVPKVAAYEAFLKARHHQAKVTPDSWALAKTYYSRRSRSIRNSALLTWAWASTGWRCRTSARSPPMTLFPRREQRLKRRYGLTGLTSRGPRGAGHLGSAIRL